MIMPVITFSVSQVTIYNPIDMKQGMILILHLLKVISRNFHRGHLPLDLSPREIMMIGNPCPHPCQRTTPPFRTTGMQLHMGPNPNRTPFLLPLLLHHRLLMPGPGEKLKHPVLLLRKARRYQILCRNGITTI